MGQVGTIFSLRLDWIRLPSYVSLVTCIKTVSLVVTGVGRDPPPDVFRVGEHLAPVLQYLLVPFGPHRPPLPLMRVQEHCGSDLIGIWALEKSWTRLSRDAKMKISLSRLEFIGMTWSRLECNCRLPRNIHIYTMGKGVMHNLKGRASPNQTISDYGVVLRCCESGRLDPANYLWLPCLPY